MERATEAMGNTFDDYAGENVTLHNISYGKAAWIACSESGSSDEVLIQGQSVKREERSKYVYCHCGKCDWSWYLQGWQCWYDDVYYDCLTTTRLALHDLMTGELDGSLHVTLVTLRAFWRTFREAQCLSRLCPQKQISVSTGIGKVGNLAHAGAANCTGSNTDGHVCLCEDNMIESTMHAQYY